MPHARARQKKKRVSLSLSLTFGENVQNPRNECKVCDAPRGTYSCVYILYPIPWLYSCENITLKIGLACLTVRGEFLYIYVCDESYTDACARGDTLENAQRAPRENITLLHCTVTLCYVDFALENNQFIHYAVLGEGIFSIRIYIGTRIESAFTFTMRKNIYSCIQYLRTIFLVEKKRSNFLGKQRARLLTTGYAPSVRIRGIYIFLIKYKSFELFT